MGWGVGESPTQGWVFVTGISPESKEKVEKLRKSGVKVAAYWIGSDSLCAVTDEKYRKNIPEYDIHFCVHERIQKELAGWQVSSHVLYPCWRNFLATTSQKKKKLVGVYMPDPGRLYMYTECVKIAEENSNLNFLFYGLQKYDNLPKNVLHGGRLTPEQVAEKTSDITVMLRLTQHDGFPVGGIEAKIRNLHVIENYPYPGFLFARTMEDVNEYLRDDLVHAGDSGPWPSWYRENCSPERFKEQVFSCLNQPSESLLSIRA